MKVMAFVALMALVGCGGTSGFVSAPVEEDAGQTQGEFIWPPIAQLPNWDLNPSCDYPCPTFLVENLIAQQSVCIQVHTNFSRDLKGRCAFSCDDPVNGVGTCVAYHGRCVNMDDGRSVCVGDVGP